MAARLRKFFALAPGDRRLLLRALPLVASVRLGLWLQPRRTLRGVTAGGGRPEAGGPPAAEAAGRIVWAIEAASRMVPGSNSCLVRALAAQAFFHHLGLPARLRLGVIRGDDGRLGGHAWVECEGRIVTGGPVSEGYTFLRGFERGPS